MAESPKLTTRELAALIKAEEDFGKLLKLIEEFCKAYDAEHVLRHEKSPSDRRSDRCAGELTAIDPAAIPNLMPDLSSAIAHSH